MPNEPRFAQQEHGIRSHVSNSDGGVGTRKRWKQEVTMKRSITAGGLALASAAFVLGACGSPYGRSYSYYDRPYYSSSAYVAYNECYGRYRPAYCAYPTYTGTVVIAGSPYRGLRYRNGPYGREVWFDGRWVRT
jgi:hypothetical protein